MGINKNSGEKKTEDRPGAHRGYVTKVLILAGVIVLVAAAYFTLKHFGLIDFFGSREQIREYVAGFGVWAPLAFFALQFVQVIITPIPGNVTTLAGGLLFGFWPAFLISTAAVCIGSVVIFVIVRAYGRPLVIRLIREETVDKYLKELSARQRQGLILMFLFPFFPDDTISLIAGLTPIKLKEFVWITILTRPWGLMAAALIGGNIITVSFWGWVIIVVVMIGAFAAAIIWGPAIEKKIKAWYKRLKKSSKEEDASDESLPDMRD